METLSFPDQGDNLDAWNTLNGSPEPVTMTTNLAPINDNDLAELTQFVFDQSAEVSENEADNNHNNYGDGHGDDDNNVKPEQSRGARTPSTSSDSRPERVVRRRARKACVACHKRCVYPMAAQSTRP